MVILIDTSQLFFSLDFNKPKEILKEEFFNDIESYVNRFHPNEVIMALDSKKSWRKTIYPLYKANREEQRNKSNFNWTEIFKFFNELKIELNKLYKTIEVNEAEADDIIAVLAKYITDDIIIISSDKDFYQLHNEKVTQFSTNTKSFIVCENPQQYLKEKIIIGDSGDNIPNINDEYKYIARSVLKRLIHQTPENNPNFIRNKILIDLNQIPINLKEQIETLYDIEHV